MLSSDAKLIRKEKRFYFDKRWIESEGVQNIIAKAWLYDCNGLSNLELALKSNIVRRSFLRKDCNMMKCAYTRVCYVTSCKEIEKLEEKLEGLNAQAFKINVTESDEDRKALK